MKLAFSPIIAVLIVVYFIVDQFKFSRVTKTRFFFLPLFCLYQFLSKWMFNTPADFFWVIGLLVISWLIGTYQSRSFATKLTARPAYYSLDPAGNKTTLYRSILFAKGGRAYLIGWGILFAISLGISVGLKGPSQLNIYHELVSEISKDLMIWLRVTDHESNWQVWELLGLSSSFYLVAIRRKSKEMVAFFNHELIDHH